MKRNGTENPWYLALRRFGRNKAALAGGIYLLVVIIIAAGAGILAPYSYYEMSSDPLLSPTMSHIMGTDEFGRDIFSRLVYGARVSITVGFLSQIVVFLIGFIVGGMAGFFGGGIDMLMMRIADIQFTFPPILLALVLLGTIISRSLISIVVVIGLTSWPAMARLIRSQVLTVRKGAYVEAALAYGATSQRILIRHVLPNIIGPITVQTTFGVANAIMIEAFLSFIGLGTPPPTPSWGGMLSSSFSWIRLYPIMTLCPALALSSTLVAINLLGDGIRDALDPKSERRIHL